MSTYNDNKNVRKSKKTKSSYFENKFVAFSLSRSDSFVLPLARDAYMLVYPSKIVIILTEVGQKIIKVLLLYTSNLVSPPT